MLCNLHHQSRYSGSWCRCVLRYPPFERAQIEALPGLEELEAAIGKIDGATFKDGVVRRTGKRVLTTPKKPAKPAA